MKSLDGYIANIEARRPFASTKINHGFWERLVVCDRLRSEGIENPVELDRRSGDAPYLFETGFFDELMQLLARVSSIRGTVDFSATPYAFPACRRIESTPAVGVAATNAVIERAVPAEFRNRNGLQWKESVSDGSLVKFFHSLRSRDVVLIGPHWLDRFGLFAALERFRYIPIHPRAARQTRHSFLREVVAAHRPEQDTVYLIQAGTYATWLVLQAAGHSGPGDIDRSRHRSGPLLPAADQTIQFVEDKQIDVTRLDEILSLSRQVNHWANFGPVSKALELVLAGLLEIPATRTCVVCASGTVALMALAGLHSVKAQRPIRWVSSAYGFFSLATGAFAGSTTYVDCDETGFLDLDAVERGKVVIVDGAAALLGVDRSAPEGIDEAISLHHTKPWGVGEGGCAIVAREDADLVRSLLNVGIGGPPAARPYALNGKMSDIAAAAILERMERLPNWRFFYDRQRRRIETIASAAGLAMLGSPRKDAIAASVPVLAPAAVSTDDFSGEQFTVRKYYRPLVRGLPRAEAICSRLLSIPCHPGMTSVPTDALHRFCMAVATIKAEAKIAS